MVSMIVCNFLLKLNLQDKRRAELREKRTQELKKSVDITSLLNDMLKSYVHGVSTCEEKSIMNELFSLCKSLQISIKHCAAENDDLLSIYY